MIKRKVMEDVGKGAFDFVEKEEGDGWNIARWGEDLWFGIQYMEAGYQAWNDFDTVCKHEVETNTVAVNELMKQALNRGNNKNVKSNLLQKDRRPDKGKDKSNS